MPPTTIDAPADPLADTPTAWLGTTLELGATPGPEIPDEDAAADGKAEFDHIYNRPDARAYYLTLADHGYEIPQHGAEVARRLLSARAAPHAGTSTVLDVCCSYGVGGTLLTTDLRLEDLFEHYRRANSVGLGAQELIEADRELLGRHRHPDAPRAIGLDVAENAVEYAVRSGALTKGLVADLEQDSPVPAAFEEIGTVDLILSTGGIGYVTERTFSRLLETVDGDPWLALFCLRAYDFSPIEEALRDRGFAVQRASRAYPQRCFVDTEERDWAIEQVLERDLDPTGLEDTGRHHAELYVCRPQAAAQGPPLDTLLAD